MTQPVPYSRGYSFTDFASGSPNSQPPGSKLDQEFDGISRTLGQVLGNLAVIQRDDTQLRNRSVGVDQLAPSALALLASGTFKVRGPWVTATAYAVGDIVSDDGVVYLAMQAHTAGVLATDVAAGKLAVMFDAEQADRVRDTFTGDGVTTAWTLSQEPVRSEDVQVFVNGLLLEGGDYAVAGDVLTITPAVTSSYPIEVFTIFKDSMTPLTQAQIQSIVNAAAASAVKGDSAYQVWLNEGNTGDEAAFLASIATNRALASAIGISGSATNLGTFTSPLIDDNVTVKAAIESIATNLASGNGATFTGHQASGTGAVPETLAAILNRQHVWPEQYDTMQQAFDAAAARQAQLWFQPNKTYQWPDDEVVVTGKVIVQAQGARIECAHALTALTFRPGSDGSRVFGGAWVYTGLKPGGYNALSNGIWFQGIRNGPGVAPTFLTDVGCEGASFVGWGSGGLQFEFTRNSFDKDIRASSAGYYGVFCYSVDLHRSNGLFVNGLSGQIDGETPETSELNAYGFTATALTSAVDIDRVRDPRSRDIVVENGLFLNIPTWHAIDSHGADQMIVRNCAAINCRRGVVLTSLTEEGSTNCLIQNFRATNLFGPGEVNVNGSSKKGEGCWDIGPSAEHRNKRNRWENCSTFGHGSPASGPLDGLAAVTMANTEDCYYNIEDDQSFRAGWFIGSNITRASIKARTVDTRSATINPSVARIEGDNIDLRIIEWTGGKRNPGIDTNVMVNGLLVVATNTNCAIKFETFDLTDCTAGEIVSTSGTTIAATLSGNVTLPVTLTATGMTTSPTCEAKITKSGRKVTCQIPSGGLTGTSNATAFTITGVPSTYWPAVLTGAGVIAALDGSNFLLAHALVAADGVITLTRDADNNTSAWTASGLKGVRSGCLEWVV